MFLAFLSRTRTAVGWQWDYHGNKTIFKIWRVYICTYCKIIPELHPCKNEYGYKTFLVKISKVLFHSIAVLLNSGG